MGDKTPAEMTRKELATRSFEMGVEKGQADARHGLLLELRARIKRGSDTLSVDAALNTDDHEKIRLGGKADGMRVALSYVEEMLRA